MFQFLFFKILDNDADVLILLIMSNAHSGYVIKQNFWYLAEGHPMQLHEQQLEFSHVSAYQILA
jgi:hypothetical protein